MSCPSCGFTLQKISVTTTSGGRFNVDHCGRCGGTWFDPYEVNRIPYHEVTRLAKLTVLPKRLLPALPTSLCPRCSKILQNFHSESMPAGLEFLRCPACQGIWATQKALEEFKNYQEKTITEYKREKTAFPALSVIFVPAIMILFLVVSTFATISHLQETKEGRIKAAQIISSTQVVSFTPTSVSISFQTRIAAKSDISYGTSTLEFTSKTISDEATVSHGILLTNLKPDTAYLYIITLEDNKGLKYTSAPESFKTAK